MPITIGLPFYNAENYLTDAIRSIFAQTYQDWELILLDDGSTDGSLEIAYSVKDPRVRVLSDGKNKKLATRLNEITQLAKYDFIARMDADDLILPTRLEMQMQHFQNTNIDIVTTGLYSVTNDLTLKGVRGQDYEYPKFADILNHKIRVVHAAILARKTWYQRNKYDENLKVAQDLDLWLRASKKNDFNIKSISDPLYIYREEQNIKKDKLLEAGKNERKAIFKYAYSNVIYLVSISYAKSAAIYFLDAIGQINILQKKRVNQIIPDYNIESYQKALNTIKNTKIPGIDG